MPTRVRTNDNGNPPYKTAVTPRAEVKREFARRLYRLMIERGWTQAEFGRRSGIERDIISSYCRGRSIPAKVNLEKLAAALDVPLDDLLPSHETLTRPVLTPSLEIRVQSDKPGAAWLHINRSVPIATALKVAQLIEEVDNADDRGGSGDETPVQHIKD